MRLGKVTGTSEVTEAIRWDSSSVPTVGSGAGVTSTGGSDGVVVAGGSLVVGGALASGVAVPLTVLVHPASSTAATAAAAAPARRPRVPVTSGQPISGVRPGHAPACGSTRRSRPVSTS
ncbi:hypothetical protein GCM10027451_22610 [Geodermatophilus aquaeductus]